MNKELNNRFWANLKITSKWVGAVFFLLSAKIVFDSLKKDDNDGIMFPLYVFALCPVMFVGVYIYTILKASNINKYLSSLIFGALITALLIGLFMLSELLSQQNINLRFVSFNAILFFVCLSLIYLQLPWRKNA